MNAELEDLIVLQAQDLDLGRYRKALADAPRRVQAAQAAFAAAQHAVASTQASIANEEKLRRGQESEISSLKTKLERLGRSLEAATSTAQVSAFEKEIAFTRDAITKLEDEELASMERTEAHETALRAAQSGASSAERALAEVQARAAQVTQESQTAIAGLEQQRKELRAQIDPDRLATYDRLTKTKGTAVAEALGNATAGKCAACQMGVRPQRWQDLIGTEHANEIFTCESCGRILFWDPRRNSPRPWEAGDRLRDAMAASMPNTASGSQR